MPWALLPSPSVEMGGKSEFTWLQTRNYRVRPLGKPTFGICWQERRDHLSLQVLLFTTPALY